MGKPLLTDEIIERANQGEHLGGYDSLDSEDTLIIATDYRDSQAGSGADFDDKYASSQDPIFKSRRIENAKRGEFQSKLNLILLAIVLLLAVLIYAVLKL